MRCLYDNMSISVSLSLSLYVYVVDSVHALFIYLLHVYISM